MNLNGQITVATTRAVLRSLEPKNTKKGSRATNRVDMVSPYCVEQP